jgi:hypothetical protein
LAKLPVFVVVYVAVAIVVVLKWSDRGEAEAVLAGVAGVAACDSMIFFS